MSDDADGVSFEIRIEGDNTGELWTGTFRARKRLSHKLQLKKDQVRRELLGGQSGPPTDRAASTAMILSELAVRLTKVPAWWTTSMDGLELEDDNVIGVVFDKAMLVEAEALAEKKKKAEKAIEEMRATAAEEAKAEAESLAKAGVK